MSAFAGKAAAFRLWLAGWCCPLCGRACSPAEHDAADLTLAHAISRHPAGKALGGRL